MKKLYVLVRSDISKSQQAVQSCHAVAALMGRELWDTDQCGDEIWPRQVDGWSTLEGHIVILKAKNEDMLKSWMDKVDKITLYDCTVFHEPDLNNEMTALAVIDHDERLTDLFDKLPLL